MNLRVRPSLAQKNFPNKPVTLVIPFPAGGGTDNIARMIQPKLAELLGTSIIIDNKPGASGVIATNAVAKAAPDGCGFGTEHSLRQSHSERRA